MDIKEDEMEMTAAQIIAEKDEIIGRLIKENVGLRLRIEEAQNLLSYINHDYEKLSLRGSIKAVTKKIHELEEELRNLKSTLPKL